MSRKVLIKEIPLCSIDKGFCIPQKSNNGIRSTCIYCGSKLIRYKNQWWHITNFKNCLNLNMEIS